MMQNHDSYHPILNIVVILYRTAENRSATLSSLTNIAESTNILSHSRLTIWDNSPCPLGAKIKFSGLKEVKRIYTTENKSLSSIYNQCAEESINMDALCILDQDTTVNLDYFIELQNVLFTKRNIQCFLPLVRANTTGSIISPGDFGKIRGGYWKKPRYGEILSSGILAIGSGLCVRTSYLIKYKPAFDERLTLYGVDSQFLIQFSKHEKFLYVLISQLFHGHSAHEKESWAKRWFRFRNWHTAWSIIHQEKSLYWFIFQLYSALRLIKIVCWTAWERSLK